MEELQEHNSIGFLGFSYTDAKHLLRPIVPDGSPSQLLGGKNLFYDNFMLRTVPGLTKWFPSRLGESGKRRIMGIYPFILSDGTIYFVICCPSKIYSHAPGDSEPTDITGDVSLTGTETDYFDACYWADTESGYEPMIIMTNGVDPPVRWNGTGNIAELGGSPPTCQYMVPFANHLVASYVKSGATYYSQRDQWSNIDNAEDWSAGSAGSNDLRNDFHKTVGSLVFGDIRYIFKEGSIAISQPTGTTTPFRYSDSYLPIGCIAPKTIIKTWRHDYGFFLAHDMNCYLLTKGGSYIPIGDDIVELIRDYNNDMNIGYSFAFYYPAIDSIMLAIPSSDDATGYCDTIFAFDMGAFIRSGGQEKIWSPPIQYGVNLSVAEQGKFRHTYTIGELPGTIGDLPGSIGDLYQAAAFLQTVVGDNDGYVWRLDKTLGTVDGVDIDWELILPDYKLGNGFGNYARLEEYNLFYRVSGGGYANVFVSTNGGRSYDSYGSIAMIGSVLEESEDDSEEDSEEGFYLTDPSGLYLVDESGRYLLNKLGIGAPIAVEEEEAQGEEMDGTVMPDVLAKKHRIKLTGVGKAMLVGQRFWSFPEGRF